ncbi:MAG: Rpn family recombination-promoting nuclease/putative transposase [Caldilineaceae bacterium]
MYEHPRQRLQVPVFVSGLFRQLVESFVEESWVATLDFDRATLLDKSFVSAEYAHAEADLLWQAPLQGRTEAVYFYLP